MNDLLLLSVRVKGHNAAFLFPCLFRYKTPFMFVPSDKARFLFRYVLCSLIALYLLIVVTPVIAPLVCFLVVIPWSGCGERW
jgi:hypothetical protein